MYTKLILFTVFSALLAVATAQDLSASVVPPRPSTKHNTTKCFTCDSPSSCLKPKAVICDQTSANSTRLTLTKYFLNVSNVTNPQFECLRLRSTSKKSVQFAVSGCINFGLNACDLQFKNVTLESMSKSCTHCSTSLCNPAGTFSSSPVIIVAAIFVLLLLKG